MKVTTLSIDLAKNVFQLHGVNEFGKPVIKKQLKRDQMAAFLVNLPPCLIGMEACGSAHYWARKLQGFGHTESRGLSATNNGGRLFALIALIAQSKVGHHPGRIEPRMRIRRPKPNPWLKASRAQARQQVEKHGHAKNQSKCHSH